VKGLKKKDRRSTKLVEVLTIAEGVKKESDHVDAHGNDNARAETVSKVFFYFLWKHNNPLLGWLLCSI